MLNWVNFLHLYQPPNQSRFILRKVAEESYAHIVKLLKSYPRLKLTLNISGSLIEQLQEENLGFILEEIKQFIKEGRVELVGSAMYHPILSLLPEEEIRRQITLNNEINERVFGSLYSPSGFYIPEMAYSRLVGEVVRDMGFSWVILDEAHLGSLPNPNIRYRIKNNDLSVLFRSRKFSKTFPPEAVTKALPEIKDAYLITAHDGELYGHWHKDEKGYYEKAFTHPEIKFILVSEYLKELKEEKYVTLKKTNWESTLLDEKSGIHFALWDHPENKIHRLLWKLADFVTVMVEKSKDDVNYSYARSHLDRGLSSCSWWWAAEAKPDVFSPITWNPDVIERGLRELIVSIRSLKKIDPKKKIEAEKMYTKTLQAVWQNHWTKYS
jgi:alpha-amylase/alpha-mannosidase (GH57 family)